MLYYGSAVKEIRLTNPPGGPYGLVALVDDEDYWRLMLNKWHYHLGYARMSVTGSGLSVAMQYVVIRDDPPGPYYELDHVNGNKLDNQKSNLKWATHGQNIKNWHGLRGTARD